MCRRKVRVLAGRPLGAVRAYHDGAPSSVSRRVEQVGACGSDWQRLLAHRVAPRFLGMIVRMAWRKGLVSDEHFSVDGTLIDAWGSAAAMTPTPARPMPRPSWRARVRARKVGWPTPRTR